MAQQSPIRRGAGGQGGGAGGGAAAQPFEIPDKLYFRIGEVAKLCGVPAYVLRFWESEFPQLKPNKGGTGQRLYRLRDVEMALRVKGLLYDEGYTITGARQAFKAELRAGREAQNATDGSADSVELQHLKSLQKELQDLHALLLKPAAPRTGVLAMRPARAAAAAGAEEPGATPGGVALDRPLAIRLTPRPQLIENARKASPTPMLQGLFDDIPPQE